MSISCGIGDAIAVIKVAMHLYDSVIGAARDARREFGLFSRELKNLKSTLEGIKRECGPRGKLSSQYGSASQGSIISDLEEAVEFIKESLSCWNALLEDFRRRSQTIPWRLAWARKYQKITQCRDRIHIQSKLLEIVMLRIQTSQNCFIISEIQELKNAMPPMPSLSDTEKLPDSEIPPEAESARSSISFRDDISERESTMSDVTSIIQSFDEKISRIKRQRKRIRCGLQAPENTPSEEFVKRFQESVDNEYDESLPETWLRLGTWWLLKSMKMYELLGTGYIAQSYVDLLKASWILYNVLGMSKTQSPETQDMIRSLSPQEWTLLENLGSAITYHTNNFKGAPAPDAASLDMANFNLWEPMAAEEFETSNLFEPTLDPRRWITIEEEHAGIDDEKVLYRSFVQAQIGVRAMRLLVEDTDYMLCLVVPSEETDPTIILSNQAGTMNLSCSCSSFQWPPDNQENETVRRITIPFGKRSVPVTFKDSTDYKKFTSLAHIYLEAVKDREPTEQENKIFQCILQGYHENNINSGKPVQAYAPNHGPCYWDLRIHETTSDKYWQTTRRLVISSCARAENPKCISFFLPPSWVFVSENPQNSSEVTLKWSDCSQRDTVIRTGGSFNKLYTYGCFPENPNHSIKFVFLNQSDAIEFSKIVLSCDSNVVSKILLQSWSQNNPEYRLFRVRDLKKSEGGPEHYKELVVTKSKNSWAGKVSRDMEQSWKHSEIYFFGRDIDFVIDDNNPSVIDLMGVYYPLYLSTHIDQPRDATALPGFSHAVVKKSKVTILLDTTMMDELRRQISPTNQWDIVETPTMTTEVKEFMSALSDVWSVVLSMRVISIEYMQPALFLAKPKKVPVYLQVWRNGMSERLVARRIPVSSGDPQEWISVQGATESSFSVAASHETNSDRIVIRRCTVWRGKLLDTVKMQATNGKDIETPLKVGEFVIRFQHTRQRDEFKDAFRPRRTNSDQQSSSSARSNTYPS